MQEAVIIIMIMGIMTGMTDMYLLTTDMYVLTTDMYVLTTDMYVLTTDMYLVMITKEK